MERIYTDYTASGRQIVLNNVPTEFSVITVENIRLIFNETQKNEKGRAIDPLVSTGCKENVESITYNGSTNTVIIILASTVPEIDASDKLTIKIDMGESIGDIDLSNVAKQGINSSTSLTVVDDKIDNFYDTFDADIALQLQGIIGDTEDGVSGSSQTVTEVERLRTLQESYDALSANNNSVVEFFGITPLQGYEFMTDTEVTDELEDTMKALDNELTPEQAAAITTEAMQIINTQNS